MPLYHFVLKTGDDLIPDRNGGEWPTEAAAREEAALVAQELMRNQRGVKRRAWRIEIRDENLRPCFELLFAEVDETISHLPPELRETHIVASRRMAACFDTVRALHETRAKLAETLSRANTAVAAVARKLR
jgi:hypothetical protein